MKSIMPPSRTPKLGNRLARTGVVAMLLLAQFAVLMAGAPAASAAHGANDLVSSGPTPTTLDSGVAAKQVIVTITNPPEPNVIAGVNDQNKISKIEITESSGLLDFSASGHDSGGQGSVTKSGNKVTWTGTSLDAGDSVSITFRVDVADDAQGSVSFAVTATEIDTSPAGNPGTSTDSFSLTVADIQEPVLTAAQTADTDDNGKLDRITLTWDEDMGGSITAGQWSVTDGATSYTVTGGSIDSADGTLVHLDLTEIGTLDGDAEPTVTYATGGTLTDANGVAAPSVNTAAVDAIAPVILSATTVGDGFGGIDQVNMTWSEPIHTASFAPGDFNVGGSPATGGSCSTSTTCDLTFTSIGGTGNTPVIVYLGNTLEDANGVPFNDVIEPTTDGAAPVLAAIATDDVSGDGQIDRLYLTFSEAMAATSTAGDWNLTGGYVASGQAVVASTIQLTLVESGTPDTGALPGMAFDGAFGTVTDASPATNAWSGTHSVATDDGAAPVLVSVEGGIGGDEASLTFSEGVRGSGTGGVLIASDFTYGNVASGGATGISSITHTADAAHADATLSGADIQASDIGNDTVAPKTTVTDSSGNTAVTTAATLGHGPITIRSVAGNVGDDQLTVSFSRAVEAGDGTSLTKTNFTVTGGSCGCTIDSVHHTGSTVKLNLSKAMTFADIGAVSVTVLPDEVYDAGNGAAVPSQSRIVEDLTGPTILSVTTWDGTSNGRVDQLNITFNEAIDGASVDASDFANTTGDYTFSTATTSDKTVYLGVNEIASGVDSNKTIDIVVVGAILDLFGNNVTGVVPATTDGAPGALATATSLDRDGNGRIDAYRVAFSEAIDKTTIDGTTWTVEGGARTVEKLQESGCSASADNELMVCFTEAAGFDTDALPTLAYDGGASPITDATGIPFAPASPGSYLRGTTPLLVRFEGELGASTAVLTFSEPVTPSAGTWVAGTNFQFTSTQPGNGATAITGMHGSNPVQTQTVGVSLAGTINSDDYGTDLVRVLGTSVKAVAGTDRAVQSTFRGLSETAADALAAATTRDADGNGSVDQLRLQFHASLDDTTVNYTYFSTGAGSIDAEASAAANSAAANDTVLVLVLDTELAGETTPWVRMHTGGLRNQTGGLVPLFNKTTTDGVLPIVTDLVTMDADLDGRIDNVTLTMSEPVQASTLDASEWSVTGYDAPFAISNDTARTTLTLSFNETGFDTGATPIVTYDGTGVRDDAGNIVTDLNRSASDAAAPVLVAALTADLGGTWGQIDNISLVFSEPVNTTSFIPSEFDVTDGFHDYAEIGSSGRGCDAAGLNCSTVQLNLTEAGSFDTGATPGIDYGSPTLTDVGGLTLVPGTMAAEDRVAPVIQHAQTRDMDADGSLDAYVVTFSESLNSSTAGTSGWAAIDLGAATSWHFVDSPANTTLHLNFTATGSPNTGDVPNLTYQASGLQGLDGNAVATHGADAIVEFDGAGPALLAAKTLDQSGDGWLDAFLLTFSEELDDSTAASPVVEFTDGSPFSATLSSTGTTANDHQFIMDFGGDATWSTAFGTGELPAFNVSADMVADDVGNMAPAIEGANVTITDGAAPVLRLAQADVGTTTLRLFFSEGVSTVEGNGLEPGDLDLLSTNGVGAGTLDLLAHEAGDAQAVGTTDFPLTTADIGSDFITVYEDLIKEASGSLKLAPGDTYLSDELPPTVLHLATVDDNGDGMLDGIRVDFSESVSMSSFNATRVTIDGETPTGSSSAGLASVLLSYTPGPGDLSHTGHLPAITLDEGTFTDLASGHASVASNATESAALLHDEAAPAIVGHATDDVDEDGFIDRAIMTLSENVTLGATGDWNVTGYNITSISQFNATTVHLELGELGAFDTGAMPLFNYTGGAQVADDAGNMLPSSDGVLADGARPVLVAIDAMQASKDVTLFFSEAVERQGGGSLSSINFRYHNNGAGASTLTPTLTTSDGGSTWHGTLNKVLTATDFTEDRISTSTVDGRFVQDLAAMPNYANGALKQAFSDQTAPAILTATTGDVDRDGRVDSVLVTFTEAVYLVANATDDWGLDTTSATSYLGDGVVLGVEAVAGRTDQLRILVNETGSGYDTAATGLGLSYAGSNVTDRSPLAHRLANLTSNVTVTDGASPVILTATTVDSGPSFDGQLDRVNITLSEPLAGTANKDNFTVGTYTLAGLENGWNTTTKFLVLTEKTSGDTGATPTVGVSASKPARDAAGNPAVTLTGLTTMDGARPVLQKAVAVTNVAILRFSEAVYGDVGGGGRIVVSDFGYSDDNGVGASKIRSLTHKGGQSSVETILDKDIVAADTTASTADKVNVTAGAIFDVNGLAAISPGTVALTKDLSPPGAPTGLTSSAFTTASAGWSKASTGSFQWQPPAADPNGRFVEKYQVRLDSGSWVDAGNSRQHNLDVGEGSHTFSVRVVSVNGQTGPAATYAFKVDSIIPVAPAITSSTHATSGLCAADKDATWSWSGGSDAGSGLGPDAIAVAINGATVTATNSTLTRTNMTDGTHTLSVSVTDLAGNVNTSSYSVLVDNAAPSTTVSGPTVANSAFTVRWSAADTCGADAFVIETRKAGGDWETFYDGNATVTSLTRAINGTDGGDGVYEFRGKATDKLGNEEDFADNGNATLSVLVDATAPSKPGSATATALAGGAIRFSWDAASDAGTGLDEYKVYRRAGASGNFQFLANASTSTLSIVDPASNTQDGVTYHYQVEAHDKAGNVGARSSTGSAKADHDLNVQTASQESLDKINEYLGTSITSLKARASGSGVRLDSIESSGGVTLDRIVRIGDLSSNDAFLLAKTGQRPGAFWIPLTDEVVRLTAVTGTVTTEELTTSSYNVEFTVADKEDGEWIEIKVPDAYSERSLLHVSAANGSRILSGDSVLRDDGSIYVLDDPETTYVLAYGLLAGEVDNGDDNPVAGDPNDGGLPWWAWLLIGLALLAAIAGGVGYYLYQRREDLNWA